MKNEHINWKDRARFLFGHLYKKVVEMTFTKITEGEGDDLITFIAEEKEKSYEEGRIYQLEEDIEQVEIFVPKKVEDTERFWIPTQILVELEDDLKSLKSKLSGKNNG